ncbi:MAG: nuclear transport factor 2 family protein [Chloroflexota bacterium]
MSTKECVESYLSAFFGERIDLAKIRTLIADDFTFMGPLMTADSADDYIQKLQAFGENARMQAEIQHILIEGETAVARYDFIMPNGRVPASEWYRVKDNKLVSMQLTCDPRSFLPPT